MDEKKTADKVRKFLDKDFERYLVDSGQHRLDLRSPILDPTGVSAHGKNYQEEKMIRNLKAEFAVKTVADTIGNLTDTLHTKKPQPYKTIIYRSYILEMYDKQIYQGLHYSSTNYGLLKNKALCEFAERFEFWKVRDHATDLPDLRCWKVPESENT